jgi:predicted TIM-barrel fold metal-dependent hydrolase
MTSLAQMPIIDIDTHWVEPPDFWTKRAPAGLRDVVPRIERTDAGVDQWVAERGTVLAPVGYCVIRRDASKIHGKLAVDTFEEIHPSASQPKERLRIMDQLGLTFQVLYPNTLGFGAHLVMNMKDPELRDFCLRAYNDGMAEVQAEGEGRLYPQAAVPFWDIDAAVKELERAHDRLGLTGFVITDAPETWGLPTLCDRYYDPLWSVAQERGLPVNFHIGGGFHPGAPWQGWRRPGALACTSSLVYLSNVRCITNLIFSGLLDRFPSLKFVSVESGIGWLPFQLELCEYQYDENAVTHLELRPTEYFQRQIYASYWFEDDAETVIRKLGADNIMFETDFPHPTCLYPSIREKVQQTLGGLAEEVQRKVLYETAASVYQLNVPHR